MDSVARCERPISDLFDEVIGLWGEGIGESCFKMLLACVFASAFNST